MPGKYGHGTTTIGALKKELKSFIGELNQTKESLQSEIRNIDKSAAGLRKEYDATAANFARNTLTELDGPSFDQVAALAQNVPELTEQGLSFYRQSLFEARDEGLKTANSVLKETVDVSTFPDAMLSAQTAYDAAKTAANTARQAADSAAEKMQEWNGSNEHAFVKMDEELRGKGKPGIAPDTKSYYDTESLIQAIVRYIRRDESYRKMRRVLVDYKQGFDGKDAFADVVSFKKTEEELKKADSTARTAEEAANKDYKAAKSLLETLSDSGKTILTDDQILGKLQERLADYLETPEFMKAASDQYGEDFPSNLPLLAAKLKTLDKLRGDAREKLEKLDEDIRVAGKSYDKMRDADTSRSINVDLDKFRKDNARYRDGYSHYTGAARQSRNDTTSWTQPSQAQQDNGISLTSIWGILLLNEVLTSHQGSSPSGPLNLPSVPSAPASTGGGGMDLGSATGSPSSSLNLNVSLNDLFRDVASGRSNIDFSPPPPPPAPTSYSPPSSSNDGGGFGGFGGGGGGGMNSGGSMDL